MNEELGYEVTPKQSLDGLWKTMHKYIEHHGYSDISLEIEGSQYEFRQHLQKYDEYEAKAKAFDRISEEVMLTKFDIFEKELIDEDTGYLALGKELARFVTKYERTECDD